MWWMDKPNITRLLDFAGKKFEIKPTAYVAQKLKTHRWKDPTTGKMMEKTEVIPARPGSPQAGETGVRMDYKGITATTEAEYLDKVSDKIALELVDLTMWPYRKGGQPAVLRTGMGRVMGQYGMYPMNYLDFMRRAASKLGDSATRSKAMKTMGLWAAVNYAAVEGMEELGAESSQWFWTSPGAYAGGPNLQFSMDLLQSMEQSDEGRAARSRVVRYPVNFIPLGGEMRNILRSMDENSGKEGLLSPEVIRVLGMRPYVEKDEELDEFLYKELGMAPAYRR
jgi:hypothetical protein